METITYKEVNHPCIDCLCLAACTCKGVNILQLAHKCDLINLYLYNYEEAGWQERHMIRIKKTQNIVGGDPNF